jgi:hypothetical protein
VLRVLKGAEHPAQPLSWSYIWLLEAPLESRVWCCLLLVVVNSIYCLMVSQQGEHHEYTDLLLQTVPTEQAVLPQPFYVHCLLCATHRTTRDLRN